MCENTTLQVNKLGSGRQISTVPVAVTSFGPGALPEFPSLEHLVRGGG